MPEQPAMSELVLSSPFRRTQRALAHWLEQGAEAQMGIFGARRAMQSLSGSEWTQLMTWLQWLSYAARANGNPQMVSRVERLAASLGRSAASHRGAVARPHAAIVLTRQPASSRA